eukprot:3795312-Pyramimonas_sp.AAC.1
MSTRTLAHIQTDIHSQKRTLVSDQNPNSQAKRGTPHGDLCQAAWNDAWDAGNLAEDACRGAVYDA